MRYPYLQKIIFLSACISSSLSYTNIDHKREQLPQHKQMLNEKIEAINDEIQSIKDFITSTKAQQHDVKAIIHQIDLNIQKDTTTKYHLDIKKKSLEKKLKQTEVKLFELEKNIQLKKNTLSEWLTVLWKQSNQPSLYFLKKEKIDLSLSDLNFYASYIYNQYEKKTLQLEDNIKEKKSLLLTIEKEKRKIKQLLKTSQQAVQSLQSQKIIQKQLIQKIEKQLTSKKERRLSLENSRKNLDRTIAEMTQKSEPSTKNKKHSKSKLIYPPLKNFRILYGFGDLLKDSITRSKGVFFQTNTTQEVRPIKHGKVVFKNWLPSYGWVLIIDHSNEEISIYANVETFLVEKNDIVTQNDIIALTGNSGGHLETGLYFEFRKKGKAIDPNTLSQ